MKNWNSLPISQEENFPPPSSQKYRRNFFTKIFSDLACSQIWLHLPVNHHHFGCNTNLRRKKKHLITGLDPVSYYLKAVHHPKYSEQYHFTCVTGTGPDLRKCPPGKCTKLEKKYGPKEDCTVYHSCLLMHWGLG
jgi:hypothetical protein